VSPAGCSAIVARRNADFGFTDQKVAQMNRIIYVIGLIVVIVFVLGFFGLR
jgi:hypothetical protein